MSASRHILAPRRAWLPWEDQLLRELFPEVETAVVCWFLDRPDYGVYGRAAILGVKKRPGFVAEIARERSQRPDHGGIRTRFKKGNVSHNKGKKGVCAPGCEKSWFPKGHQRADTAPVGAERVCGKDGYLLVKVADKGTYKLPWRLKQRVVWEQHHGPIPPHHIVTFKDGNRQNCDIGNLELKTRRRGMAENTIHNYPQPIKHTMQVLGQLKRRINERDRKQQQQ